MHFHGCQATRDELSKEFSAFSDESREGDDGPRGVEVCDNTTDHR